MHVTYLFDGKGKKIAIRLYNMLQLLYFNLYFNFRFETQNDFFRREGTALYTLPAMLLTSIVYNAITRIYTI